jgi:hypothetical protein
MSGVFLFIFTCFWSTLVLCFDVDIGRDLWKQFESSRYPIVMGRVTRSEVVSHRGSKSTSYSAAIWYRYVLNDHSYDCERFRYVTSSSSYGWVTDLVNDHPVGSQVQVYFNPSDPADAVLSPDLEGGDLMIPLFLTPFNLIMLGFWAAIGGWLRERIFKPEAGGVKIIVDGPRTSVRLPEYGALVWCMVAMGVFSLLSILVVGFATQFRPSMGVALLTLFLVIASGASAYFWQWRKIHSGEDDLIFDESTRTVGLPETHGRKTRITLTMAEIEKISVEVVEHHSSKGGTSYTYAPTLWTRRNQRIETEKLADWSDQKRAEAFAEWLRQHMNMPVSGPPVIGN